MQTNAPKLPNQSKPTKLVRLSEKAFEGLYAFAGKLQTREKRRVSLDGAVLFLLSSKGDDARNASVGSAGSEEKTSEKPGEVHMAPNEKKSVSASKKPGKTNAREEKTGETQGAQGVFGPMKLFSFYHSRYVSEDEHPSRKKPAAKAKQASLKQSGKKRA